MPIKHAFTNPKSDPVDATITRPSDWNADHTGSTAINIVVGPEVISLFSLQVNPGGANAVNLLAFQVFQPVTVTKAYVRITVVSGNIDIGIYSSDGTTLTRLASSGSVACPSAVNNANVTLTASVTLVPGVLYYSAVASDNATTQMMGSPSTPPFTGTKATYAATVASSMPLPATIAHSAFVNTKVWGAWFA